MVGIAKSACTAMSARFAILALALACGLIACEAREEPRDIAAAPESANVLAPNETAAADSACYMKGASNETEWRPARSVDREAKCFEQDDCSGGLGGHDGVCYKWALGANEPALMWSATLTHPKPKRHVPPPQKLHESAGEVSSDCLDSDGCESPPVRLKAAAPLYARADPTAPLVATANAGECVQSKNATFLAAPQRGIVLETRGPFTAGEVIYLLAYDGDYQIWWRGEASAGTYHPDTVVVRWDKDDDSDPRTGNWVEYQRASGERGWARNPKTAEGACVMAKE
jgi:hypothetical protein